MMAPVVVQLDDDNCDGKVNERDIPEIVFQTFAGNDYNNASGTVATLHAIAVVNGQVVEKWSSHITGASADVPGLLDRRRQPRRHRRRGDRDLHARRPRARLSLSDGTEMWLSEPSARQRASCPRSPTSTRTASRRSSRATRS